ncbi:macrocin-O-methyltransferase TylF [Anseongella ginsenosidimutans]|uniref:Macrocin-O-methyltransferase TylF n=1 Tax=Anseongella ginsenosidimutans TaxID=496056 RepID=A0A4R3KN84_9SPHI|nr:TylF/MycF/NovP-related O-methyltransferase [Anseongella ginsenosidimutans]QEC52073.1 macrocin O-methyltransferase [Anseongella ginsenosidimutans]TCS85614.1 macrocin-O-methyltransferase TylF [Anseongella ginsenosidimutans]
MKKIIQRFLNRYGYHIIKFDKNNPPWEYPADFGGELRGIIEKVKPYTMTLPERLFANYEAVNYITRNGIEGAITECGVWRGGSTMTMLHTLLNRQDTRREIFMYDTFDGMSEPGEEDKAYSGDPAALLLKNSDKHDPRSVWCYASLEDVQRNVLSTGYPQERIHFVKGKVEDTIPATIPEKIAILRLDTDWYESTLHELEHLYPRLQPGGVLLIDDYGHWEGARKAVDEYIREKGLRLLLCRTDYSGRIAIKPN